jgi:hypothetical protein
VQGASQVTKTLDWIRVKFQTKYSVTQTNISLYKISWYLQKPWHYLKIPKILRCQTNLETLSFRH